MGRYPPEMIANAFLYKARAGGTFCQRRKQKRSMTHMKLQKLVYFMYAWGLAFGKNPVSERPQAWEYGPVFFLLFHILKTNGSRPVKYGIDIMNPETGRMGPMLPPQDDHELWELLESVWERYGEFDAMELSAMAHEEGSPWEMARNACKGFLDDSEVAEFYRKKLEAQQA